MTAILVDAGVVTDAQVETGLARQRETGRRIGECLVELGIVSEEDIAWALARQLGLSFVDVQSDALDPELVRSLPEAVLRRLQFVPIVRNEDRLIVAAVDPTDEDGLHEIEKLADTKVDCVAATAGAIERALDGVFGPRTAKRAPAAGPEPDRKYDILWERSGETFLQFHLTLAMRAGADEVHFVQAGGTLHVLHRIGAQLTPALQEPADVMNVLIHRLEALGMPAAGDHEGHQTWSGVIDLDGKERPIFASRLVARDRVSVTVRQLRDLSERVRLEHIGLDPLDLARLRGLSTEPSGLVLVCGPTGSGCSTTLAALLAELPTEEQRWIVFARHHRRWPAVTGLVEVITGPTVRHWRKVAIAHGADGLVLDGGLAGARVHGVLGSATHARWVLARTDWEDSFALIEWLTSHPNGRSLLSRRLKAVIQQRLVAAPPSATEPGARRIVYEVLFATDPLLAAIHDGADVARMRKIAAKDGFRPLEALIRAGVESGDFDPMDARRALA